MTTVIQARPLKSGVAFDLGGEHERVDHQRGGCKGGSDRYERNEATTMVLDSCARRVRVTAGRCKAQQRPRDLLNTRRFLAVDEHP